MSKNGDIRELRHKPGAVKWRQLRILRDFVRAASAIRRNAAVLEHGEHLASGLLEGFFTNAVCLFLHGAAAAAAGYGRWFRTAGEPRCRCLLVPVARSRPQARNGWRSAAARTR